MSTQPDCQELIVHVKDDYDDRYQFELPFHKKNLMNVVKFVLKCINGKYVFFEVPCCNLRRYATSKSAHSKGKHMRPPDMYMCDNDLDYANFRFQYIEDAKKQAYHNDGQ